jgi:transposase-like protein
MMHKRSVFVDLTTIHRWALKILPVLAAAFRHRKQLVGNSWRMDETYVLVGGQWKYLYRAIDRDGATANTAVVQAIQDDTGAPIELRQVKYLNDIIEQDHRVIKPLIRPMFGFQTFSCARILLAGIETVNMIKKGQLDCPDGQVASSADQFYSRAA